MAPASVGGLSPQCMDRWGFRQSPHGRCGGGGKLGTIVFMTSIASAGLYMLSDILLRRVRAVSDPILPLFKSFIG